MNKFNLNDFIKYLINDNKDLFNYHMVLNFGHKKIKHYDFKNIYKLHDYILFKNIVCSHVAWYTVDFEDTTITLYVRCF